jgi:hypothetical protein
MPIDARIPLGIEPSRSKSPQDAYSQAMQRQGQQQNMAIREAQLRKLREEEANRNSPYAQEKRRRDAQNLQDRNDADLQRVVDANTDADNKRMREAAENAARLMDSCLHAKTYEEGAKCFDRALTSAQAQGIYDKAKVEELRKRGWSEEMRNEVALDYKQTKHFLDKQKEFADKKLTREKEAAELKRTITKELPPGEMGQFEIYYEHWLGAQDPSDLSTNDDENWIYSFDDFQKAKAARATPGIDVPYSPEVEESRRRAGGQQPTKKQIATAERARTTSIRQSRDRALKAMKESLKSHGGGSSGAMVYDVQGGRSESYIARNNQIQDQLKKEIQEADDLYRATTFLEPGGETGNDPLGFR